MSLGFFQILIILAIILLLFGAGKLPKISSDIAKSLKIFKKEMEKKESLMVLPLVFLSTKVLV